MSTMMACLTSRWAQASFFGASVDTAGDFNGDGVTDRARTSFGEGAFAITTIWNADAQTEDIREAPAYF